MRKNDLFRGSVCGILIGILLLLCGCKNNYVPKPLQAKAGEPFDPYAYENHYDVYDKLFSKQPGVDYGTVHRDVSYWSTVAGDYKQCNVLLPAGYDEKNTYPVMYVVHGFWGEHGDQIDDNSYLTLLYGNMLHRGLTVPMILVNLDMYTDRAADKDAMSDEQLRHSYDKVITEIHTDLMPFIEKTYPVSTERKDTAIAGMSEGGAKALCIGFTWPEEFGWIGAFAPDTGVIPTEFYKGSFWSEPIMEDFPELTDDTTPYYLYLAVGTEDPYNVDCTLYYRDVLNEKGIRNQTDLAEGYAHKTSFWRQCFYNFLAKVFK